MDNREAIGSWIEGPRAAAGRMGVDLGYRGEQLGLPEKGPGSVAPAGRRLAALSIDWCLCLLIAYGLITGRDVQASNPWTTALFLLLSVLTIGTLGSTPGKRLLGLRVVRTDGARLGFGAAALRTVLLLLVVPAVIWDRDTRGLHDRAAKSVQVRV